MKGYITRGRVDGTWYLRAELPRDTNGKRRQHRETVRGTKAEAQRRLRDLLRELETGGHADGARVTVAALAQRWLDSAEHRVTARTYAFYAAHVRLYITPSLGSLRAEQLRPAHVEAALAAWRHGKRNDKEQGSLSARTVAHVFNTLRTLLRWGVKMGMLVRNVADAVESPRYERKEMRSLESTGIAKLLKAAQGRDLQAVIAVAIGTGLRRGELLGLRWSDIDLVARRLTVRRSVETVKGVTRTKPPKTARSARTIALPPFVVEVLRDEYARQELLRGSAPDENAWVFVRGDGSPWEPGAFSLAFARFVKSAKLPHVRFHDLRHSFGTLALASGVDLQTVSRALGHESVAITSRIYLHAVDALQADAAARIDALLGFTVTSALAKPKGPLTPSESVPQPCHASSLIKKNARKIERLMVAPTGIELSKWGPGSSRALPKTRNCEGFRFARLPALPAKPARCCPVR
ncbi:MAG: tyrosine-type recombinase/integrase [Candidatus Tyrphobacter sp.]